MSRVLVVDTQLNPLHPCTPARARLLLKQHKASVLRRFPFTIVLRSAVPETPSSQLRLKLDPGSRTTGLAVVNDATGEVVWAAELWCALSIGADRAVGSRRLSPSLAVSAKSARQPAHLGGQTYVLAKWNYTCAYCGVAGVSLELDHVFPRSRGGSNRASNRVAACHRCNQQKGNSPIEEYLQDKPAILLRIQKQLGLPKTHWLDAACVGATTSTPLRIERVIPLHITATGRQRRQMVLMDKCGFPRSRAKSGSCVGGFRTGDVVRATVSNGYHYQKGEPCYLQVP